MKRSKLRALVYENNCRLEFKRQSFILLDLLLVLRLLALRPVALREWLLRKLARIFHEGGPS